MSSRNYHHREALQQVVIEFATAEERAYEPRPLFGVEPPNGGYTVMDTANPRAWIDYEGPMTEVLR